MSELRLRYGAGEPEPGVGILYKAEVRSEFGWAQLGHYESVAAFEKLYEHLQATDWEVFLDIHLYLDPETGDQYRLRPIHFLRE